eukprot:1658368-Pyramimonas_sp.AAC.1
MINLWRAHRVVRMGTSFHPAAPFATSGLPAGGSLNHAFAQVYTVGASDSFMGRWKESSFHLPSFVDDGTIAAA